jgi:ketosteroid isomerase-like protein
VSDNVELVRAWHRAAAEGRIEDLLALTHPEFEMTEASALPGAAHVQGREGLRSYAYGWAKNWSEWEWLEEELAELPPDWVIFVATLRLRGLRSSVWVEHRWAYLIVIRDGLVLRDHGFQSKEELLESPLCRPG